MPKLNLKMSDVINDRFRAQHFYRYAKKAFCAENLDFVYACRQISPTLGTAVFRPVPLSDASDPSRGAAYVYERFIQGPNNSTAREEVNINYSTKSELKRVFDLGQLTPASFRRAHEEVLVLLETDTWKKFATPDNNKVKEVSAFWDNNELRGYIKY